MFFSNCILLAYSSKYTAFSRRPVKKMKYVVSLVVATKKNLVQG